QVTVVNSISSSLTSNTVTEPLSISSQISQTAPMAPIDAPSTSGCRPKTYASSISHQPAPSAPVLSAAIPVANPNVVSSSKVDRHGQAIIPLAARGPKRTPKTPYSKPGTHPVST